MCSVGSRAGKARQELGKLGFFFLHLEANTQMILEHVFLKYWGG